MGSAFRVVKFNANLNHTDISLIEWVNISCCLNKVPKTTDDLPSVVSVVVAARTMAATAAYNTVHV